ncbi:MAG: double-strand break repair helicase AddA [Alphaproteobacteria bacterium]|nr:double-strand break repair helicase AddA [Alphaproteobacteria bacterium]
MSAKTITDYKTQRENLVQLATKQQHAAANPNVSVWVSASAGTGKTRVLSDRVLRMLLKNIDAAKILCLTYTKAAAVEMKNRIFERLSEWAVTNEDELEKNLLELLGDELITPDEFANIKKLARTRFAALLDTPGGLKIQTIHSFCQEILKRFPLEAEILPYFDIMEDREVDEVLHSLQNKIQTEAEKNPNLPISLALQYLNAHLDENSFPKVMKNIADKRSEIASLLCQFSQINDFASALQKRLQINPQIKTEDLQKMYMAEIDRSAVKQFLPLWQSGKKQCDLKNSALMAAMSEQNFPISDYAIYTKIFSAKNIASAELRRANPNFDDWIEQEKERTATYANKILHYNLYAATLNLMIVAAEFISQYEEFKHRNGKMDYTDLILLTKNLLQKSQMADWVLFKLDGGIDHILIDEAQDTSPSQWDIIGALSAEFLSGEGLKDASTIFAVGDRKQSIFSFQGADPDKYDQMAAETSKSGSRFQKVDLEVSFRSAPAILETVNKLFASPQMSVGVVTNGENVHHIASRAGEFGEVQIWPLMVNPADYKTEKNGQIPLLIQNTEFSLKQQMAEAIVNEIIRLHTQSQSSEQPLHYSDFMVLVQRRKSIVNEFIRACKKHNIPVTGADKLLLSSEIVVQDLISLGKFLLLPEDDLSLAEVLKSPLFGLDDDDLTELCYNRRTASLWQCLLQNEKYATVSEKLQNLLNKVDFLRPFELYTEILTTLNVRYKMTLRMGMEIEDSLDEFMNLALSFEKDNIPTLQGFIRWLEQAEVEIKRETDSKDIDAVRLMTVHRSKGLQAPVVFLPDSGTAKTINREQNLLIDDNIAYYPLNKDYYDENCDNILEKEKQKHLEESKRLLYVAMTRAEDRLYICAFQNGNSSKIPENSWFNMCQNFLCCENDNNKSMDQIWRYTSPHIVNKRSKEKNMLKIERIPLPTWINEPVADVSALAKPWTPSKPETEDEVDSASPLAVNGNYYRRGTIIHKLLQYLPQTKGDKQAIMQKFLQRHATGISESEQQQIIKEVLNLLNDERYAVIFGSKSRAEVPIMGEVDGKIISAQLDRLVVLDDKVIIVDFKTNRPAASNLEETPPAYKKQLTAYTELVQRIYPHHKTEAYILWTNVPRLMQVI